MSIFGKKNLSLDEILKGIESLSEEDKAKVRSYKLEWVRARREKRFGME